MIATTGLRRGEALGPRWDDIDLAAGRISVNRTLVQARDYRSGDTGLADAANTVAALIENS